MAKIVIHGACGTMGKNVAEVIQNREGCEIAAGLDHFGGTGFPYPIYSNYHDCKEDFDVIIDFSHVSCLDDLLQFALSRKKPVVIATTGFSEEQQEKIRAASKEIPVFFTYNMSLGISLLQELASKAAKILGKNYDIEIVEKHHNKKVDAPSGTAIMLADSIAKSLDFEPEYVYDRHSVREKREHQQIGFSSVRGGTIVGEHEIIFAGTDEVITLSHGAYSKKVFAEGSVSAALFLCGQPAGLYNMSDLVSQA